MRRAAPQGEPHPVVVEFTADLRRVHGAAGSPGPRKLLAISRALPGRPVLLCKSTLHDNLQGARRTLHPWEWVATFIRALRVAVAEDELDPDELIGTVEQWRQRYVTAKQIFHQRNAGPGLPLPASVPQQATVGGGAEVTLACHSAERPASEAPREYAADSFALSIGFIGDPQQLILGTAIPDPVADPAQTELPASPGELFGDHGIELLHGAVRGDSEAQARLGILLLCRSSDPQQALSWLDDAASHGDLMAQSLRRADPTLRRELAAAYAFELAQPVDGSSALPAWHPSTSDATVYYEAAAEAGHPGAAYRLGALSEDTGDITQALRWYEMATGYADAPDRRNRLRRDVGSDSLWRPPTP